MKEEIFLFYRENLSPRIRFVLGQIKKFLSVYGLIKIKKNIFPPAELSKNLLIRDRVSEQNLLYYRNLGIEAMELEFNELKNLDVGSIYFLLGSYEEVLDGLNYLRKLGIRAIWRQIWMKENNNKPFWKRRVAVVEAIYSDLMTEQLKERDVILDEKQEWIDFENCIFNKYIENKSPYKKLINEYLREGWDLNRINPVTISILLEAIAEYDALKTDALVLITQSVKTAKNYCEKDDYKIVNAILDKYFRNL